MGMNPGDMSGRSTDHPPDVGDMGNAAVGDMDTKLESEPGENGI